MKLVSSGEIICECGKLLQSYVLDLGKCVQVQWTCECGHMYVADLYIRQEHIVQVAICADEQEV